MSYILDALKRADAERGLTADAVHTEAPAVAHRHHQPAPLWRSGTGVIALVVAALGLAGLAALWWPSAKVSAPVTAAPEMANVPVAPAAPQATPIVPAAPPPMLMPEPAAASSAPPPGTPTADTEALGRPAPILLPERPVAARPTVQPAPGAGFGPDPVPTPPAVVARQPVPTPSPPAAATTAPSVPSPPVASSAPASAPPVKVTGATYSDNPAHRMLIVNGKVVLEGQDIEPGLKLEVITPHSAVLNHQGSRFNINY